MKKNYAIIIFLLFFSPLFAYDKDEVFWNYQKNGSTINTAYYELILPRNFAIMPKDYWDNYNEGLLNLKEDHQLTYSTLLYVFSDVGKTKYPPLSIIIDVSPTIEIAYEEDMIEASRNQTTQQKLQLKEFLASKGCDYKYVTLNNQFYLVIYSTKGEWRTYTYTASVGRDYAINITATIQGSRANDLEKITESFLGNLTYKNKIPKGYFE